MDSNVLPSFLCEKETDYIWWRGKKISTISLIFQQIQQHPTKTQPFRQAKILRSFPKFSMKSDSVPHGLTGNVLCRKNRGKSRKNGGFSVGICLPKPYCHGMYAVL